MDKRFEAISVLIVEDTQPTAALIQSILKSYGCIKVRITPNGKEGFDYFCQHTPDIVIADWSMKPINGLELAHMIRKNPSSPNPFTPIIMLTAHRTKQHVQQARDHGVNEFLIKPFTAQDLYKRVVHILENPREFIEADTFFGPDRRRKAENEFDGSLKRDGEKMSAEIEPDILETLKKETKNIKTDK